MCLIFKNIWYLCRNVTGIRLCPLLCFYLCWLGYGSVCLFYENRKGLHFWRPFLVIRLGLEPRTPTLKVLCSTCWASESILIANQLFPDCGCKGSYFYLICKRSVEKSFNYFISLWFVSWLSVISASSYFIFSLLIIKRW